MNISHFANTIVGKPGNIGVRTERIIQSLAARDNGGYCLSRMSPVRSGGVIYRDMGWLGHLPRILNAFRIYIAPGFNHRYPDVKLFEWFALRYLSEALQKSPNVAHVWDACPILINALKSAGVPILLDMPVAPTAYSLRISKQHGLDFLMVHQSMLDFEHASFELADMIAAPSQFVADELMNLGVSEKKIRIVSFGVDAPALQQAQNLSQCAGRLEFAFIGNVNRRKGADLLLEVWDDPEFKQDRLHLCGRIFPEIQPYLTGSQGGTILRPGFIKPFEYLQHCDVFVFPSWLEGSAKAVYEAMACGLPVIVTHSAGSIVRDGIDGFIIDAGDKKALREHMLWFKDNPERIQNMGIAAANRAREFTWLRYANSIMDIYQELSN